MAESDFTQFSEMVHICSAKPLAKLFFISTLESLSVFKHGVAWLTSRSFQDFKNLLDSKDVIQGKL